MKWTLHPESTGQPITDLHQTDFSSVAEMYHNQNPGLPDTYIERARVITKDFSASHREALIGTLEPFLQELGAGEAAFTQLQRLADPNSVVVVAGQQAGLFSGPLYSVYKALSAVGLAKRLEKELGRPVVPVFWIASEDHDWGEVDHAYLLDREDEVRRIRLPQSAPLHQMVHSFAVSAESGQTVLRQLEEVLPEGPWRHEVIQAVTETFEPGTTMAVWFGKLMYRILGDVGIVLSDPCLPGLRHLVGGVWKSVIENQSVLSENVTKKYELVEERGFTPAVVRDESNTALFYVEDGKRYVMERTDNPNTLRVRGLGIEREVSDWIRLAETTPTSFSSNVLLRPVVQDFLFPTLAFVGGPSEIAYHVLSAGVFETLSHNMPPLVLRDRLAVYPPSVVRNLEKWGYTQEDVLRPRDLQGEVTDTLGGSELDNECALMVSSVESRWESWREQHDALGPQVRAMADAQSRREVAGIRRTFTKTKRLLSQKHDTEVRQLRHIERWLWVDGHPQERRLCPMNLWSKYGLDWLKELDVWGDYREISGVYHVTL